jgi:hypothetical protein
MKIKNTFNEWSLWVSSQTLHWHLEYQVRVVVMSKYKGTKKKNNKNNNKVRWK